MSQKQYIKSRATGFKYDKYWNKRDKIFDSRIPRILRAYYKFYLRRVDAKNGADINIVALLLKMEIIFMLIQYYTWYKRNCDSWGAQIGNNVTISNQVTIRH